MTACACGWSKVYGERCPDCGGLTPLGSVASGVLHDHDPGMTDCTPTCPVVVAARPAPDDQTEGEACCVPTDGEEHCNHHPEWHESDGCHHPTCAAARAAQPDAGAADGGATP